MSKRTSFILQLALIVFSLFAAAFGRADTMPKGWAPTIDGKARVEVTNMRKQAKRAPYKVKIGHALCTTDTDCENLESGLNGIGLTADDLTAMMNAAGPLEWLLYDAHKRPFIYHAREGK